VELTTSQGEKEMAYKKAAPYKAAPAPTKKPSNRWHWHDEFKLQCWNIMKEILDAEKWNTVLGDKELANAMKYRGCLVTRNTVRDLRIQRGVGPSEKRKLDLFKAQAEAKAAKK